MSKIFFSADTHFGHKNIIKYSNRPFETVEEMDNTIIKNWNLLVGPDDVVYHLGDMGLCSSGKLRQILNKLNGRIHLIRGNHEKSAEDCKACFEWIKDYYELEVPDPDAYRGTRFIVLFHYAMRVWNASHYGTWHLYGHSHAELEDIPSSLSFDVGMDSHAFKPISYSEVKKIMGKKTWKAPSLRE